eukprot:jgi/Psemu1/202215/e_gw1.293.9.1
MGGDDLGSDDDYLAAPLRGVEDYGDDNSKHGQKRQRGSGAGAGAGNEEETRSTTTTTTTEDKTKSKSKSKKRAGGPMEVLGSKIRLESAESKAEILSKFAGADFKASHMAKLSSKNNKNKYDVDRHIDSNNFMDRLLCLVSKKQLKNKQQQRSPRAVIFCLSARRSVAVLKELAPMKLRVAKLFPKQGTIGEQARQLESNEFGVAIGTPHRIKELIDRGSLTLKNTQLLGFDTFMNPKNQSVYTLHDTAPFLKSILKEHAEPICSDGKMDLKIGFV